MTTLNAGQNQVLIHPKAPAELVEVPGLDKDVDMATLSHSATIDLQQDKSNLNVSPISDNIFLQPGPQPIEIKQLPTKHSPDSPLPSNNRSTQIHKPHDLSNTPR